MIFRHEPEKRGYIVSVDEDHLPEVITDASSVKDFGNARGVRNLVDRTIAAYNRRIGESDLNALSDEAILAVTDEDLK